MGDIAEAHRQRRLTDDRRQNFENVLYRWIRQLPQPLRLFVDRADRPLADRDLANLQLHVPYFACLLMLYKDAKPESPESTAALIAASFIVGILEDIAARDEIRYLPAIFPFYALAAGLVGLSGYRHSALRSTAEHDFSMVKIVLEQLGHRWQSAKSALAALTNACETVRKQPMLDIEPNPLSARLHAFFETLGAELCRFYHLRAANAPDRSAGVQENLLHDPVPSGPFEPWEQQAGDEGQEQTSDSHDYGLLGQSLPLLDDPLPPVGSWLFDDIFFGDQMGLS